MGGMNNMFKQAQKLQKEMQKMQEELSLKEYEAAAGGDMVTVRINGKLEIRKIKIAKDIIDPDDIEMLEDLVMSAVNAAIEKAQEAANTGMKSLTKGMNLPGMTP